MPQMKNSSSSVPGDSVPNEHGGEVHSDGAGISSWFLDCRVGLLSLLVLVLGLMGGFMFSQKSETMLLARIKTLENDIREADQLKQRVLTSENDLIRERAASHGLKDSIEQITRQINEMKLEQTSACLKTVMYDIRAVTTFFVHDELYLQRREALYDHIQFIMDRVNFYFIYDYDELDVWTQNKLPIIKKSIFGLSDSHFIDKVVTERYIREVSNQQNYVLCLSASHTICNYPGVHHYQMGIGELELKTTDMQKIEEIVKQIGCK